MIGCWHIPGVGVQRPCCVHGRGSVGGGNTWPPEYPRGRSVHSYTHTSVCCSDEDKAVWMYGWMHLLDGRSRRRRRWRMGEDVMCLYRGGGADVECVGGVVWRDRWPSLEGRCLSSLGCTPCCTPVESRRTLEAGKGGWEVGRGTRQLRDTLSLEKRMWSCVLKY